MIRKAHFLTDLLAKLVRKSRPISFPDQIFFIEFSPNLVVQGHDSRLLVNWNWCLWLATGYYEETKWKDSLGIKADPYIPFASVILPNLI